MFKYAIIVIASIGIFKAGEVGVKHLISGYQRASELEQVIDFKESLLAEEVAKVDAIREQIAEAQEAESKWRDKVNQEQRWAEKREADLATKESTIDYQKQLIADCRIDIDSLRINRE